MFPDYCLCPLCSCPRAQTVVRASLLAMGLVFGREERRAPGRTASTGQAFFFRVFLRSQRKKRRHTTARFQAASKTKFSRSTGSRFGLRNSPASRGDQRLVTLIFRSFS